MEFFTSYFFLPVNFFVTWYDLMPHQERTTHFQIVTSAKARVNAFESIIGKDRVHQILHLFTEDEMLKPINHQPAEWPTEMSQRKAFQDVAANMVRSYLTGVIDSAKIGDIPLDNQRVIRLYSDTINIVYAGETSDDMTTVLEKPISINQFVYDRERGAMALSGKYTEVCTGLTAIDITDPNAHPATILVRTTFKAKPFTKDDVKKFVERHGEHSILKSASGISFINDTVELFDTSSPLRTYVQTDPNLPPMLLFELPTWGHLTQADRQKLLYGAIPEALRILLSSFPTSNPNLVGRSTAERYNTPPS